MNTDGITVCMCVYLCTLEHVSVTGASLSLCQTQSEEARLSTES